MVVFKGLAPSTTRTVQRKIGPDAVFARQLGALELGVPEAPAAPAPATAPPSPQPAVDTFLESTKSVLDSIRDFTSFDFSTPQTGSGLAEPLFNTDAFGIPQINLDAFPKDDSLAQADFSGITFPDAEAAIGDDPRMFDEDLGVGQQALSAQELAIDQAMQSLLDQQTQLLAARDQALAEGNQAIADQYSDQIATVDSQIANLGQAKLGIREAFAARNAAVAPAFQQAIAAPVPTGEDVIALRDRAVKDVQKNYAKANKSMNQALETIGAADPAVQKAVADKINEFAGFTQDALVENLNNEAGLIASAGKLAKATARAAYGNDQELMRREEEKIQIELQAAIDAKRAAREKLLQDMAKARTDWANKVNQEFDGIQFGGDPFEVWDQIFQNYSDNVGWDFQTSLDEKAFFDELYGNGVRTQSEAQEFIKQMVIDENLNAVLSVIGFNPDVGISLEDVLLTTPGALEVFANGNATEIQLLIRGIATELGLVESATDPLPVTLLQPIEELDLVGLDEFNDQLSIWEAWDSHVEGWESTQTQMQAQLENLMGTPGAAANLTIDDMTAITGGNGKTGYLLPPAANAYNAMAAAARAAGINLSFSDTYRSYETQMLAYQTFLKTGKNLAGNTVPNIAHPDSSNHPKGLAIDFTLSPGVHDWLRIHGPSFGWYPISNEAWHWEYRGTIGSPLSTSSSSSSTTTTSSSPSSDPSPSGQQVGTEGGTQGQGGVLA